MEKPPSGYVKAPKAQLSQLVKQKKELDVQTSSRDDLVKDALVHQAMAGGTTVEDWKDIKPLRSYNDIKRKAYVQQKKKEIAEERRQKLESAAEYKVLPFHKRQRLGEQRKHMFEFKPEAMPSQKPDEASQAVSEQDQFKKQILEQKQLYNQLTEEEKRDYDMEKKRDKTAFYVNHLLKIIGKQGFQVFHFVVEEYKAGAGRLLVLPLAQQEQALHNDLVEELVDGIILAVFRTYIDRPLKLSILSEPAEDAIETDAFFQSFDKKVEAIRKIADDLVHPDHQDYFHEVLRNFCRKCENLERGITTDSILSTNLDKITPSKEDEAERIRQIRQQRLTSLNPGSATTGQALPQNSDEPEQSEEAEEVVCCMCLERGLDFYKSKCKHVACKDCWDTWFGRYLECPVCRRRLRSNQIRKI